MDYKHLKAIGKRFLALMLSMVMVFSGTVTYAKPAESEKTDAIDDKALKEQLTKAHANDRLELPYHQNIINHVLPLSIGGGIGQSRLCMFFLRKAHIGEVQASLWDEDTMKQCADHDIHLL